MSNSVFCTAKSHAHAEQIVARLKAAGFSNNDISVLMAERSGTKDFAIDNATKLPEGTAVGAGTGAVVGGTLGWLAGIGALAIPGLGPFIAAGPILAAMSGAALGGTVGGLAGALVGLGIPEYEAKRYEDRIKGGSVLIAVHTADDTQVNLAKHVFNAAKGEDISAGSEVAVR